MDVFFLECLFTVVVLLVHDVLIDFVDLGMGIAEYSVAALPLEMVVLVECFVDEFAGTAFDFTDKVAYRN